jgi:TolA-binding protein
LFGDERTEKGDENLMPHIRLIFQDDEGNPIPGLEERIYQLQGELETLDQIEQATERFKQQALPEIEHSLLKRAQERFVVTGRGGKAQPPSPAS